MEEDEAEDEIARQVTIYYYEKGEVVGYKDLTPDEAREYVRRGRQAEAESPPRKPGIVFTYTYDSTGRLIPKPGSGAV